MRSRAQILKGIGLYLQGKRESINIIENALITLNKIPSRYKDNIFVLKHKIFGLVELIRTKIFFNELQELDSLIDDLISIFRTLYKKYGQDLELYEYLNNLCLAIISAIEITNNSRLLEKLSEVLNMIVKVNISSIDVLMAQAEILAGILSLRIIKERLKNIEENILAHIKDIIDYLSGIDKSRLDELRIKDIAKKIKL